MAGYHFDSCRHRLSLRLYFQTLERRYRYIYYSCDCTDSSDILLYSTDHIVDVPEKAKIRKVTIDEKGATFYNSRNQIVDTVLYSELQHSRSSSADIYLHNNTQTVKYGKITLKVFLRDKTGEMILKNIDFNFEYIILSNTYDLYRHFLKGVQHFRPDLAIGRQTIEHYSLTSEDPPAGKWGAFEYVMAAFFLLVVLGIMYAFAVILKTLV